MLERYHWFNLILNNIAELGLGSQIIFRSGGGGEEAWGGVSHIKGMGLLVENFEKNPKKY